MEGPGLRTLQANHKNREGASELGEFGVAVPTELFVECPSMVPDFLHNITVWAAVASWMVAQFIKLATFLARERKFDYGFLFRLGGMPSSHTASSAACAVSVGLRSGFDSPVFAVALGMMALIMIDAQSVRRAAGVQARLLNQMAEEFYRNHKFSPEKLVEFLGHTRMEVLMGALLGMAVALLMHAAFPVGCPAP